MKRITPSRDPPTGGPDFSSSGGGSNSSGGGNVHDERGGDYDEETVSMEKSQKEEHEFEEETVSLEEVQSGYSQEEDSDEETISMEEFHNEESEEEGDIEEEEKAPMKKCRDPPTVDSSPRPHDDEEETVTMEELSKTGIVVLTNMPDFPDDNENEDYDENDTNTTNARANIVNGPIIIQIDQDPGIPSDVLMDSTSGNRYGTVTNSHNRVLEDAANDHPMKWFLAALARVLKVHALFGLFLGVDTGHGITQNERIANLCGFVGIQVAVLSVHTLIVAPYLARCECIEGALRASEDDNTNNYGACQMRGDDDIFFLSLQSNDSQSFIKPEWLQELYNNPVGDDRMNTTGCFSREDYFKDILSPSCQVSCPSTTNPAECSAEKVCCYAYYRSRGSGKASISIDEANPCPMKWYFQVLLDQLIASIVSILLVEPIISWLLAKETTRFKFAAYALNVLQIILGGFLLVAAIDELRFSETQAVSSPSLLWPILAAISIGLFVTSILLGLTKEALMAIVFRVKEKQQHQNEQPGLEDSQEKRSPQENYHEKQQEELRFDEDLELSQKGPLPADSLVIPSSPTATLLTGISSGGSIEQQHVFVLGSLITFIVCGVALLAALVSVMITLAVTSTS